ncbi:MAG: leucine-rich repeat domain-containing protein, partial [Prevotella sp.]|nr:leucine-rich repeat domain-containing protein [Prevotella sp.]
MKKLFTLLTLILSLCSGAWALDNGTFSYTVSGDEVTITGFASGFDVPANYDLVIPNEIEGKPVTKIGESAFQYDGPSYAPFRKNGNIKTVNIGKNVTTILYQAFSGSNTVSVTFPEDSRLTTLTGSENDDGRSAYCFAYCGNLKRITFPASLTKINRGIIMSSAVEEVTFLGKLTTILSTPLAGASSLTTINVPLEYIDDYSSNANFIDGIDISKIKSSYTLPTSGIGTFSTGTAVTLPEGLRAYYCKNYNSTAGTIATKEVTGAIPANTGVLLRGTAGETYTITASAETPDAISENALVAVTEATHVDQTNGEYTNFMMKGGKFIKIAASSDDEKMPANRAYLQLPTASIANSLNIEIDWKEETGIRLTPNPSLLSEGN